MTTVSINTRPSIIAVRIEPAASGWRAMLSALFEMASPIASAPESAATPIRIADAVALLPVTPASAAASTAVLSTPASAAANAGTDSANSTPSINAIANNLFSAFIFSSPIQCYLSGRRAPALLFDFLFLRFLLVLFRRLAVEGRHQHGQNVRLNERVDHREKHAHNDRQHERKRRIVVDQLRHQRTGKQRAEESA